MVAYEGEISEEMKIILFDPQTAGGLLIAVAPEAAKELVRSLGAVGVPAHEIGEITRGSKPLIRVTN
jgi:selenide, water dikinase